MIHAAIAKHLAAEIDSLTYSATTAGGNVFVGWMPAGPDIAVAVMPAGGLRDGSRIPTDAPVVQVLVRGERHDHQASYELAREVYDRLHVLDLVTLDDGGTDEVFVIGCTAVQSDPIPLGPDSNDRPEWSLNFELLVPSVTTNRPA